MPVKLLIIPFLFFLAIGPAIAQSDINNLVNSTSIMKQEEDRVRVFPNPTNGVVTIMGKLNGTTLQVYNVLGAQVMQRELSSEQNLLDISDLPSGVYMFRITTANGSSVVKKVIKR